MHNDSGIDWAGVPLVAELLGITDIESFLHNLITIKLHKPPGEKTDMTPEE